MTTVLHIIQNDPTYSALAGLISSIDAQSNLVSTTLSNPAFGGTFLAPDNAAILAAAQLLGYPANDLEGAVIYMARALDVVTGNATLAFLEQLLLTHVVPIPLTAADFATDQPLATLGAGLAISGGAIVDNDPDTSDATPGAPVLASNGTLIPIDNVLLHVDVTTSTAPTQGDDLIVGGSGSEVVDLLDGDDVFSGLDGDDIAYGGAGDDALYGGRGFDNLRGENGDDLIYGGGGKDRLTGDQGQDTLFGDGGNDTMNGGSDDDLLFGGSGNDKLSGKNGADQLFGDSGNDKLYGGDDNDTLEGGTGNDKLFGERGNDTLDAGKGDDALNGGSGNDLLFAGEGADRVAGNSGNDTLFGEAGDDHLMGRSGDDHMDGGEGADILSSGTGADLMTGGLGADTFVFKTGDGADTVTDFTTAEMDVIDLSSFGLGLFDGSAAGLAGGPIVSSTETDTILDFGGGDVLTLQSFLLAPPIVEIA